jgi:tryptophan-rich sensory protein
VVPAELGVWSGVDRVVCGHGGGCLARVAVPGSSGADHGNARPHNPDGARRYGVQLALNLAWTPVFFGLHPVPGSAALWLALAIIIAVAMAVAATVLCFGPISRAAGRLMLPYLSWVVFAASLNLWPAVNN